MTLWTPDGEHTVPPVQDPEPEAAPLTPEQEEQARAMARELAEARSRLLDAEVSMVIANHASGIYELAAIHLTADQPKLDEAKLAIDALGALVDGLSGRLGEAEATLRQALHQIRLAYIQQMKASGAEADAAG